ncbi:hypothetical protein KX928_17485 [Roseobacter sp. YSTF-M11]|uniref:Uncharacterized protein n=1 Tax=Roseobacter insulae TaxID=2859783 RepID=A0A9X1FXQ5_9RHOB|nr:hypothetical protein [Roseobacter insulae]MBW4709582.1 hypothetical protein [Roseobacter insulae]
MPKRNITKERFIELFYISSLAFSKDTENTHDVLGRAWQKLEDSKYPTVPSSVFLSHDDKDHWDLDFLVERLVARNEELRDSILKDYSDRVTVDPDTDQLVLREDFLGSSKRSRIHKPAGHFANNLLSSLLPKKVFETHFAQHIADMRFEANELDAEGRLWKRRWLVVWYHCSIAYSAVMVPMLAAFKRIVGIWGSL